MKKLVAVRIGPDFSISKIRLWSFRSSNWDLMHNWVFFLIKSLGKELYEELEKNGKRGRKHNELGHLLIFIDFFIPLRPMSFKQGIILRQMIPVDNFTELS